MDGDFASAREVFDPVRWVLAQAGPPQGAIPPSPPAGPAVETEPTWAATVFPFIGSGEPVGFAPARWGGTLGMEYLAQKAEGARRRQLLLGAANLNASSYFWKPWFAQVQGTLTVLVTGEKGDTLDPANRAGFIPASSLSGGGTVTVFPASRFPFLASAHSTDSRASGDYAASDYRNSRATLRQTWRDPLGTQTWVGSFDYSAISSDAFGRDTVSQLEGRYLGTQDPHRTDAVLNWSRNRQPGGAGSDILRAYASNLYTPTPDLWVSSLANLTESDLTASGSGGGFTQRLGQLSSQAVWRPEWDERLAVTGGGRVFVNQFLRGGADATAHSLSGNAGASFSVTEETTLNASLTATRIDASGADPDLVTFGSVGATYTSRPFDLGFAAYTLSASMQGAHQSGGPEESRTAGTVQADQQLSRTLPLGEAAALNLLVTQGGGVIEDTFLGRTQQLRAGVSAGLRVFTGESAEAYFGASYSGSESRGGLNDRFRLANVQASGQVRFGQHDSLSANVTAQWVRSNRELFGIEEETRQVYGGISYQHARVFGVPRLRYSLSATFNEGVLLNARILGDVDATRENVTQLVDSRLSYDIGRLELRIGTRLAKVDGRDDLQWYLRVYRHIGQY
ncbi:MAG: hypothetical protein FIB05_06385 [Betaproteobacteria bacterium]|nr:hypothetical protein [Betaproteobacteria bacterium]PWB59177.1 MAG: hypothetical protein C3F16_12535 [Betaproteobacteria bacterium]